MAGSRTFPTGLMPPQVETQYSTLEVDHDRLLENNSKAAPIVGQDPKDEKIISYSDLGKQAVFADIGKQAVIGDAGKQAVVVDVYSAPTESSLSTEERSIFGLRRKTFFILLTVILVLIIAGAVGGGVGGTIAARNREQSAAVSTDVLSSTPPQVRYENTGLAAMQYTDLNGTLHKRLYYQDNANRIRESSWDNSTAFDTAWEVNVLSDAVKPGTPIAAAAGYPHASYKYSLVRITCLSFSTTC